ncbi:MAG: right-handed parallel beta-helix repeat-containing protein [Bacteroidales bacterium]|nr:right-handed parallel beta-helix repeat-containing protein [Bacteroidales bacterium]
MAIAFACLAVVSFAGCSDPEEENPGGGNPVIPPTGELTELTSPIDKNTTLLDLGLDVDYFFAGSNLEVTNNAVLTIKPGVTIKFTKEDGRLVIKNGSTLKAEGLPKLLDAEGKVVSVAGVELDGHIKFIGASTNKGAWRGIQIESVTANTLEYVEILNAGGENTDNSAALYLDNGKVSVTNSIIDRSSSNGITIASQSDNIAGELTAFSNNTVSNNGKAPIYTYSYTSIYALRNLSNNNTFTGNTNDYIHIMENSGWQILGSMTLHHLNGYPYYFQQGLYLDDDKTLTIEPKTTILMGASQGIRVYADAHLLAAGTAENPITIKGRNDNAGYWQGIEVSSQTPGTTFDYCNISGGGAGSGADDGLIKYYANSYLELYNSNLSKSLHSGVVCQYSSSSFNVHYNAQFKQSNVTFSEITNAVFRIAEPDAGSFAALPATGSSWWQY